MEHLAHPLSELPEASIFLRYQSQSKRRKKRKRKALKEEQALSEAQLHRERTLESCSFRAPSFRPHRL